MELHYNVLLGELKPLQNEGVLKFLHIIVKKSKQENKKIYIYIMVAWNIFI